MSKPIQLVYIADDLYSPGGMQRVLTLKANYLADVLGYDVTILLTEEKDIPLYYPLSERVKIINFDLNFYRMYNRSSLTVKLIKYRIYLHKYKKLVERTLKELRPDITVSLLRKDINFINSIHDGSRKVGEIHFDKSNYRVFRGPFPAFVCRFISRLWMKQLIRQLKPLDQFIVLTNEDLANWTELDNAICIHNPATFENIENISECTNKIVIAVGRYTYQKGFDLLLKAWKEVARQHPDWELQIYGSGDKQPYLDLADELGITDTCQLHPATNDIPARLAESSLLVLSSRYEGMPLVLGEAMGCGVPPVAFACPCGPRDIIQDGVDGLLVENGNIAQLTEKISYLIEQDELRKEMGKQALQSIKRFRPEYIMPQWDQLFKKLKQ